MLYMCFSVKALCTLEVHTTTVQVCVSIVGLNMLSDFSVVNTFDVVEFCRETL